MFELSGPVPIAVRSFLIDTGYDSYIALKTMTDLDLEELLKQHKLLPGHRSALNGYRKLVRDNEWSLLIRKMNRSAFDAVPNQKSNVKKNISSGPVRKDAPKDDFSDATILKIVERFQQRLTNFVRGEGISEHGKVKEKDFIIKMLPAYGPPKFGAVCPFCQPEQMIKLFYSITGEASFQVTTANYNKHYKVHHTANSSKSVQSLGQPRQIKLDSMIDRKLKRKMSQEPGPSRGKH